MTEDDLDKFIKCLGMLSSSHDGEALNARDMDRILKKYKLTWADVPNLKASKSYSAEDRATQERARDEHARRERAREEKRAREEERSREDREAEQQAREEAARAAAQKQREEAAARNAQQAREQEFREWAERERKAEQQWVAREAALKREREEAIKAAALKQGILTTRRKVFAVAIVIGGSVGWLAGGANGWLAFFITLAGGGLWLMRHRILGTLRFGVLILAAAIAVVLILQPSRPSPVATPVWNTKAQAARDWVAKHLTPSASKLDFAEFMPRSKALP
jgi:cation transport ATPase